MSKIGHDINQQELDDIMQEHDLEKNGVISYAEFKALFLDIADTQDVEYKKIQESTKGMASNKNCCDKD